MTPRFLLIRFYMRVLDTWLDNQLERDPTAMAGYGAETWEEALGNYHFDIIDFVDNIEEMTTDYLAERP